MDAFILGKVAGEIHKAHVSGVLHESCKQPGISMAECFADSATQWAGQST